MPKTYFQFQQFRINQKETGMKVTTDACLFGAWVATQIHLSAKSPSSILDIGTGTGLLALMLAQVTETSQVDAVEISTDACEEARSNFALSKWSERLTIYECALQDLRQQKQPYNLIICNPPFFENYPKGKNNNKNQALHQISLSQDELLQHTLKHLSTGGAFYVLYPEKEMHLFLEKTVAHRLHLHEDVTVRNKADGQIFRKMVRLGRLEQPTNSWEITIKKSDGKYTDEFWNLLNTYYLPYNDPNRGISTA